MVKLASIAILDRHPRGFVGSSPTVRTPTLVLSDRVVNATELFHITALSGTATINLASQREPRLIGGVALADPGILQVNGSIPLPSTIARTQYATRDHETTLA